MSSDFTAGQIEMLRHALVECAARTSDPYPHARLLMPSVAQPNATRGGKPMWRAAYTSPVPSKTQIIGWGFTPAEALQAFEDACSSGTGYADRTVGG